MSVVVWEETKEVGEMSVRREEASVEREDVNE